MPAQRCAATLKKEVTDIKMTTNSLVDMIKVQQSPAPKAPGHKGMDASESGRDFHSLMQTQRSLDESCSQYTGGSESADSSHAQTNGTANAQQTDSDGLDLNKQIMLAAMMMEHRPIVPMQDMQQPVQQDSDGVQAEGIQGVETQQNPQGGAQSPVPQTVETVQQPMDAQQGAAPEQPQTEASADTVQMDRDPQIRQTEQPLTEAAGVTRQSPKPQEADTDKLHAEDPKVTTETDGAAHAQTPLFDTVDAMPIRVGDGFTVEKKSESEVPVQIAKQLSQPIQGKMSSVELELNPRNLGRVHVELKWLEDGSLHVSMKAEKLGTQAMLERSVGALQGMLEHDAQQPVRVEVQQSQQDGQPNNGHNGQQQDQQQQHGQNRQQHDSADRFLQELRLGLIPTNDL